MRISDWSSDVFSSDLPAIFDAECGNQGFAIFQRFWKHLQGVDEYDRHSRIRLRHQMKQHGAFRTEGGYRCDFAQRSFGEQLTQHLAGSDSFETGIERIEIGRASCRERVCKYV